MRSDEWPIKNMGALVHSLEGLGSHLEALERCWVVVAEEGRAADLGVQGRQSACLHVMHQEYEPKTER